MRIWTFHPRYLDAAGLVALWREGLLAQKVLEGKTRGYRNHPQLIRFRRQPDPLGCIANYLWIVYDESLERGYHFNRTKIVNRTTDIQIEETQGQFLYEWQHFLNKLKKRHIEQHHKLENLKTPECHPLFQVIPGPVRDWERVKQA